MDCAARPGQTAAKLLEFGVGLRTRIKKEGMGVLRDEGT
jgi:hypothetical protein